MTLLAAAHKVVMARRDGSLRGNYLVAFGGKADIDRRVASAENVESDPSATSTGSKSRNAAVPCMLFLLFGSTGGTEQ
jgi:hypothetical protein